MPVIEKSNLFYAFSLPLIMQKSLDFCRFFLCDTLCTFIIDNKNAPSKYKNTIKLLDRFWEFVAFL
jgi:hypothetical protein